MINLKDIVLETKQIETTYPGMDHFKIKLNYIPRAKTREMMDASMKTEWVNGMAIQVKDEDKLLQVFVETAIAGWQGLTLADVEKLLLIEADADPSTPVDFSVDNAMMLVRNSASFDTWVNSMVYNLDTFRTAKQG